MDDNTIEFDELSVEVNIDPEKVYSLDFGHQMAEGSEIVYMGHHYVCLLYTSPSPRDRS